MRSNTPVQNIDRFHSFVQHYLLKKTVKTACEYFSSNYLPKVMRVFSFVRPYFDAVCLSVKLQTHVVLSTLH